jgi:GalNAc-alpha-(1->4)-GalNAc-alpha-(1->3)-diNAcBac-PP-undecaprenol alpha-1,4-N-acetyl-D-galactosaminyltransferase
MHKDSFPSKALRITLVTGSLGGGGTERIVLWLAASLARAGHHPTLVTLHDDTADFYDIPPAIQRVKAPVVAGASYRWFDLIGQYRAMAALRRMLLESSPDLVISFIDSVNVQVLLALSGEDIPVIVSEQSDWRYHRVSMRWGLMREVFYRRAFSVVVLSSELEKAAAKSQPYWRCTRIPNPVPEITCADIEKPEEFGRYNVMAMGRLSPEKGFDLLLHAFKKATSGLPHWKLIIIGEGPERANLAGLIEDLSLTDDVLMPGTVSPPFDWVHAGDLFVSSSRYEGFGLALAEAMACGLAVISFNCPSGPQDIIRHDVDGILVPPEDVDALAVAMRRLMDDPDKRSMLAQRAPEICQRFSPEMVFDQWHGLIVSALAHRIAP